MLVFFFLFCSTVEPSLESWDFGVEGVRIGVALGRRTAEEDTLIGVQVEVPSGALGTKL